MPNPLFVRDPQLEHATARNDPTTRNAHLIDRRAQEAAMGRRRRRRIFSSVDKEQVATTLVANNPTRIKLIGRAFQPVAI